MQCLYFIPLAHFLGAGAAPSGSWEQKMGPCALQMPPLLQDSVSFSLELSGAESCSINPWPPAMLVPKYNEAEAVLGGLVLMHE